MTKATGRPPGRPRKNKPPQATRPRGRTPTPFVAFAGRYILATADAFQVALKQSPTNAIRMAVFQSITTPFAPATEKELELFLTLTKDAPPGYVTLLSSSPDEYTRDGGIKDTSPDSRWLNVESRVQYLLKKRAQYAGDRIARRWRAQMAAAIAVEFGRKFPKIDWTNIEEAKRYALWKAAKVGEEAFVISEIFPMIDRAAGQHRWQVPPPGFSIDFGFDT